MVNGCYLGRPIKMDTNNNFDISGPFSDHNYSRSEIYLGEILDVLDVEDQSPKSPEQILDQSHSQPLEQNVSLEQKNSQKIGHEQSHSQDLEQKIGLEQVLELHESNDCETHQDKLLVAGKSFGSMEEVVSFVETYMNYTKTAFVRKSSNALQVSF